MMGLNIPYISINKFKELLPKICDQETSYDPESWTPENPLWGHCAAVSLVAQNLFGGYLLSNSLKDTAFAALILHYWNLFPNGIHHDFTKDQFGNSYPKLKDFVIRDRQYALSYPETLTRYKLLAWRLAKELNPGNFLFINDLLFDHDIYRRCFYNALDSPCQKMKFGAVIVSISGDRNIESALELANEKGCNKTIEPLRSLCEPACVRLNIPSRTESMIDACGHAEENVLWEAVKMKIPLNNCSLYVAGIYPNGLPRIESKNEFTCLRCAVQIYNSGIKRVWIPVVNGWKYMSGEECVKTAKAYAISEKRV